ncbi:MAG TPA: TetR/AcrR family transcriptional regulator C-terminal domain-containing protein [Steroidobacteraceae bacterium]|nr:TetR/AcrR family transcriptional regulator C-terminal domain-containing protein [Steroidobacteraceae bacterium]
MNTNTSRRRARSATSRPPVDSRSRRKGAERTLNRVAVVAAALAEIDRTGLEHFSLRNVAKALGVFPTAVSWHVSGRSQLLAEVARVVLEDILPPGFHDSWQAYLREFLHRFRAAIRRHPNVAPLIGTQLVANPAVDFDFVERLLAVLVHAGLSGTRLLAGYNTVIAAAVGFTTQEFAPVPTENTRVWQKQVRERLEGVPEVKYPLLAQNMALLGNRAFTLRWQNGIQAPLDDSFDAFIEIVIAGLEQFAAKQ